MTSATKIPTTTLAVVSFMFDGAAINFPALFELRAAGWAVEIEHSEAIGGFDPEAYVWFNARKEFPDNSPGVSPGAELTDELCKWVESFDAKWGSWTDGFDMFKNPKAAAWKYHPWRDRDDDCEFWKTYEGRE
jgi:hypothetical protein